MWDSQMLVVGTIAWDNVIWQCTVFVYVSCTYFHIYIYIWYLHTVHVLAEEDLGLANGTIHYNSCVDVMMYNYQHQHVVYVYYMINMIYI